MKEKAVSCWLLAVSAVGLIAGYCENCREKTYDVVIYGSSPAALSASHMAFGSIRMEPVFFADGQVIERRAD